MAFTFHVNHHFWSVHVTYKIHENLQGLSTRPEPHSDLPAVHVCLCSRWVEAGTQPPGLQVASGGAVWPAVGCVAGAWARGLGGRVCGEVPGALAALRQPPHTSTVHRGSPPGCADATMDILGFLRVSSWKDTEVKRGHRDCSPGAVGPWGGGEPSTQHHALVLPGHQLGCTPQEEGQGRSPQGLGATAYPLLRQPPHLLLQLAQDVQVGLVLASELLQLDHALVRGLLRSRACWQHWPGPPLPQPTCQAAGCPCFSRLQRGGCASPHSLPAASHACTMPRGIRRGWPGPNVVRGTACAGPGLPGPAAAIGPTPHSPHVYGVSAV